MIRLPHVTPEMLEAAYWLARLNNPDVPLLDAAEIAAFNTRVPEVIGIPDLFDLPETLTADEIRAVMPSPPERQYYDVSGRPFAPTVWDALQKNLALDAIPATAAPRFGLVTRRTPVRTYPTAITALEAPDDLPFDQFQETTVDVGWPVAVLHTSADGLWGLALTPHYWGWLRLDAVASGTRQAVQAYVQAEPFAVATAPWAGVAMPDGEHVTAQMGTRLPLTGQNRLQVPRRDESGQLIFAEGYIPADLAEWHHGYLPSTLRSILTQAFALLGEPYGWGGMRLARPGRDCSRLVRDVWATIGILLPRNSSQQGKVGDLAATFAPGDSPAARVEILGEHVPPGALLLMPGHVMIMLGMVAGIPYVIHDLWRCRHPDGSTEMVGAVTVSALPPEGSAARRTLLERLTHACIIR